MAEGLSEAERIRRLVESLLDVSVTGVRLLEGALSTRRFYRVRTSGEPDSLVARVDAPEHADRRPTDAAPEPPLEPLRRYLARQGLPVPRRYGGDPCAGIDLLEDLGSRSLEDAAKAATPEGRRLLYAEVVDLVPPLQRLPDADLPAFQRRLDADLFAFKARLFASHSLPAALGREASGAETAAVGDAFAWIAAQAAAAPARLAHRDLQSRNVLLRPDAPPGDRMVLIDLQGAFLAPPEYDLVCLLRDSYVELPWSEVEAHCARVRPELPDAPDAETFARRFDLLTLTRKGKDHARFLQAARGGDPRYLHHLPATVRALQGAAARCAGLDPRLGRLAELVARLPEIPCAP